MSAIDRRAHELDTIASVLPINRRDELAELLTDEDVETLRHLVKEGMGDNTLRALTSDLAYLQAWSLAATGDPLPWPAPEALLLKFVAHHLWDPRRRETDPTHGMPTVVDENLKRQGFLKSVGPHAPDTVRRRIATWSTLTKWRGLDGAFASPTLKSAIRLAVRAVPRTRRRKSAKAVTADVLAKLLATCAEGRLVDIRDQALLLTAFASGGRRRSEVASLRIEDLTDEEPVPADPGKTDSPTLPCLTINLSRTKTTSAENRAHTIMIGRPVVALKRWIEAAGIEAGPIFRRIDQWGNIDLRALTPQSVNIILKSRCALAGLDPQQFSAHGLRSGYLAEAADRGIPLPEAMQQSLHKSMTQAGSYYNNAERKMGRAARLVI